MPEITDILNAIVLFSNFVLVPAASYGAQLALGALGHLGLQHFTLL
jgi:branched-chain amino acid transport system permease protein